MCMYSTRTEYSCTQARAAAADATARNFLSHHNSMRVHASKKRESKEIGERKSFVVKRAEGGLSEAVGRTGKIKIF